MAETAAKRIDYGKFWPYLKRILGVLRPEWKWLYLDLFLSGINVVIGILSAVYTGRITDAALGGSWNLVWRAAGMLGLLIIFRVITIAFLVYTDNAFAEYGIYRIRRRTALNIEQLPVSGLDGEKSGDLLSRLNNDIRLIKNFFRQGTRNLLFQPLMFIGGAAYTMTVNWKLTLLTAGVLPVLMYFAVKITKPIEKHSRDSQEGKSDLNVIAQDSISGFSELKSFTLEDEFRKKTRGVIDRIIKKSAVLIWYQTFIAPINKFIQILPIGALYFFGGILVFRGEITIGEIVIFSSLLHYISSPFQAVSAMLYTLREFIPGVERVYEIWDKPNEKTGTEKLKKNDSTAVEFSNVSFYYKEGSPVLRGISLVIPRGEITALVGHSGCGKTTVIKLLNRFYIPQGGDIKLFGRSYEEWDLEEARKHIALVNQDTYLFPDTIYKNILYGKIDASEDEVYKAAERSQCADFIRGFPNGYGTLVGERGVRLSVGQRQRVSIARAMLKDAPVLLLDEATSSLDTESEYKVQKALNELISGRTVLVIAHRLSTIKHAHRILVLKDGKIIEEGTHRELYGISGVYRNLYDNQFKEYGEQNDEVL